MLCAGSPSAWKVHLTHLIPEEKEDLQKLCVFTHSFSSFLLYPTISSRITFSLVILRARLLVLKAASVFKEEATHACIYVCMYICMYVCMYVYVCMYMYVCMCMHVYMYVYMYACIYVCIYGCVCMHACVSMCIYVCMYACMHVCMYTYVQLILILHRFCVGKFAYLPTL